jgi:hypothetical protein
MELLTGSVMVHVYPVEPAPEEGVRKKVALESDTPFVQATFDAVWLAAAPAKSTLGSGSAVGAGAVVLPDWSKMAVVAVLMGHGVV